MPDIERFLPRYAAEPPHETQPYGRWAERLREAFDDALGRLEPEEDDLGDAGSVGDPGELLWYPDRTWHGRTFVPVTARTSTDLELYGHVRYIPADEDGGPYELVGELAVTAETREHNPEWTIDICETVVGQWRGDGDVAGMTLVWGLPLVQGAAFAVAELGGYTVDRCPVVDGRFTLLAPDDYHGDTLEILLTGSSGGEVARESLYADDDEE